MPYYQCNKENKIITDGAGLFDPRTGYDCKKGNDNMIANTKNNDDDDDDTAELRHDLARTSRCNRLLEVCCLHPSCDTDEKPTTTRPRIVTKIGSPDTCGKRNKDGIVQAQNLKVKSSYYIHVHALFYTCSLPLESQNLENGRMYALC